MTPAISTPQGFDLILPYLRPIEALIQDSGVSEIMVNGGTGRVFIERHGAMEETGITISEKNLQVAVRNIARSLSGEISPEKPILDARLPDGSRVAAVFPPCSVGGTTLTIRKFQTHRFTLQEMLRIGSLTAPMADCLRAAVLAKENILISGGTGTGKTTLLNALAGFIPPEERVVLIEDTSEIQIHQANLVRFEARRERENVPAVTIRDLLKATLRHRPDRIVLGEVRGAEAFDLLQAFNTGHSGSLSTIHANSAPQALSRFTNCALESDVNLPYKAIRGNIAESLHLLVHIERRQRRRYVAAIERVSGFDPDGDKYHLECLHSSGGLA
jgi:pilus assembly protein CpaF